jgi:hypothetical protein
MNYWGFFSKKTMINTGIDMMMLHTPFTSLLSSFADY